MKCLIASVIHAHISYIVQRHCCLLDHSAESIVPSGVFEECTVCVAEEFADSGTVGVGVPPCSAMDELVRFFDLNTLLPLGSLARITICAVC